MYVTGRATFLIMQYTSVSVDISLKSINEALNRGVPARMFTRSKGTHLSDITRRMYKESGRLKEKVVFGRNTFDPIDEENLPTCMFVGMCVESLLLRMNPWLVQVGELYSDGVAMSPDAVAFKSCRHLLSPDAMITVLHEFKASWKSSLHSIEEKVNYLQQTKSYCRALGTQHAVLWIFSVMGDYRFGEGTGPCLKQYHIKFTEWEVESNWSEIMRKKGEYGL